MTNKLSNSLPIKHRLSQAWRMLRGQGLSSSGRRETHREVPAITLNEVVEARLFFPLEKFFVFGHARSGTTMLVRALRIHPLVHCNYQAHFFTRAPLLESLVGNEEAGEWLARGSNRWNRGRDLSPVVLRAAADFILERDARRAGKSIVGDKSPNSLLDGEAVRLMHKVYPDARLIYIVRDGRDAAISHRFQTFIEFPERLSPEDQKIRADFAAHPESFGAGQRSIFTAHAIQRVATGWVRNVTETDQLGRQLYGEHYLSLRYEDLLDNPWQEMQRVWGFLGAALNTPSSSQGGPQTVPLYTAEEIQAALAQEMTRNPDADWQKEKAGQLAQALKKGRQGGWQELLNERDREVFDRIAGETLHAWRYPPSLPVADMSGGTTVVSSDNTR